MARNAKVTIVEAEHIVEAGELDPQQIHVPGIYVDRIVQATEKKQIEKYTFAKDPAEQLAAGGGGDALAKREKIVKRAAKEFKNGMYANLGIGMPMLAPNFLPEGVSVTLQSGMSSVLYSENRKWYPRIRSLPQEGSRRSRLDQRWQRDCHFEPGCSSIWLRRIIRNDPKRENQSYHPWSNAGQHVWRFGKLVPSRKGQGYGRRNGSCISTSSHQGRCDNGTCRQERSS